MPKQVTYRVPDDFSERLARLADMYGLSINKTVQRLLVEAEEQAESVNCDIVSRRAPVPLEAVEAALDRSAAGLVR